MNKDYNYRPPILYIFLGLGGLYASYLLLETVRYGEIGFQFIVGFLGLCCLILGIVFTKKFIDRSGSSNLKIGDDFIEIPGRWRKRVTVPFADIDRINKIESFDRIIEISSKGRLHVIDGKCMNKNDFQELKDILTMYESGCKPPST